VDARPLRADARRNRDRLLAVAVRAFSQDGPEVTLDAIAKEAGVGIGTLYRHFPTREALIEEAYRSELGRLCAAATDLLADLSADRALRAWMGRYLDYMVTKKGMAEALRAVIASGGNPYASSRDRLLDAVTRMLTRDDGTLRSDVDPEDVLVNLTGIALAACNRAQADRLLDLLLAALGTRR
jgi:AcrR family transcriptional regulator